MPHFSHYSHRTSTLSSNVFFNRFSAEEYELSYKLQSDQIKKRRSEYFFGIENERNSNTKRRALMRLKEKIYVDKHFTKRTQVNERVLNLRAKIG